MIPPLRIADPDQDAGDDPPPAPQGICPHCGRPLVVETITFEPPIEDDDAA